MRKNQSGSELPPELPVAFVRKKERGDSSRGLMSEALGPTRYYIVEVPGKHRVNTDEQQLPIYGFNGRRNVGGTTELALVKEVAPRET